MLADIQPNYVRVFIFFCQLSLDLLKIFACYTFVLHKKNIRLSYGIICEIPYKSSTLLFFFVFFFKLSKEKSKQTKLLNKILLFMLQESIMICSECHPARYKIVNLHHNYHHNNNNSKDKLFIFRFYIICC